MARLDRAAGHDVAADRRAAEAALHAYVLGYRLGRLREDRG
jgi:hypothetical protein